MIWGNPGVHGEDGAGTQGIGVRTPDAAAVAEATTGFAGEVHSPKGAMLSIGFMSAIVAAGNVVRTFFGGNIFSTDGSVPRLHCIAAPVHTSIATRTVYPSN